MEAIKVICGILIIVVLIIAVIGMLWWLPGNGKQWLIDLIITLCIGMFLYIVSRGWWARVK